MINELDFKKLYDEVKGESFDEALPLFQKRVWEIADKYSLEGSEVVQQFIEWKKKQ